MERFQSRKSAHKIQYCVKVTPRERELRTGMNDDWGKVQDIGKFLKIIYLC
jgi:hypothetical protein